MTYFFYFESPTKIRNTSGIPKKYPKYWVEFEPLKTVLKKKNYFAEKLNYEQPQPLSQPFPFFLEEKFLVKTLTRQ
jgi:hypothetical protein